MRSFHHCLILLVVALASCNQSAVINELQPSDSALNAATTVPWELRDCEAILSLLPATAADLAPFLPEGFTPLPLLDAIAETDVVLDPFDANIGVETMVCEQGLGLDGVVEPMVYGSYYVMVEPPEQYRRDVDFHFIKWDVLIPDAARRELLVSYGVPALDGEVTTALFQQQGDFKLGEQSLVMGGSAHHLQGTGEVAYAKTEGRIAEFTPTPNGLVEWQTDWIFESVSNGTATVDVGPGNLLADVIGSGPVVGASFIGKLSFVNGQISLLPAN